MVLCWNFDAYLKLFSFWKKIRIWLGRNMLLTSWNNNDVMDMTNLTLPTWQCHSVGNKKLGMMVSGCSRWLTASQSHGVITIPHCTGCRSQQTSSRVWGRLAAVPGAAGAAALLGAKRVAYICHLMISSFLEPQEILAALLNNTW